MRRAFSPAMATLSLLAIATPCLAQEAEVTLSPPVAPVVVAPAPFVAVAPAAPPPHTAPKAEEKKDDKDKEEKDSAHFRFGMGLDADLIFAPKTSTAPGLQGFGAGLELRLGVQVNSWFAIYYQPHAVLGGTIGETATPIPGVKAPNATVIGELFNSALLEATLPVLHIGAGPSVDVLGIKGFALQIPGSPPADPGSTNAYFGVDGRVAIVIGGHGPGSHAGFAINGNIHPTFWNGGVLTTFSLGIGGELY